MTKMATMPIFGKNLKNLLQNHHLPWNLIYSFWGVSSLKFMMTLGWPWPILWQGQIWFGRLLNGKSWKSVLFCCYCAFWYETHSDSSPKKLYGQKSLVSCLSTFSKDSLKYSQQFQLNFTCSLQACCCVPILPRTLPPNLSRMYP